MTHERAVEYKYGGLWNSRALNNQPEALHPKHSQVPTSNGTEDFILQSIFVVDPRRVELHKCMQIDNLWDILGFAAWTSTKASRTCSEQVYTPLPVIAVVPFTRRTHVSGVKVQLASCFWKRRPDESVPGGNTRWMNFLLACMFIKIFVKKR